jgi:hypothetical protein
MDHYYLIGNHQIHMFQLAISIGLVALAAIIVCTILGTLLRKDFTAMDRAS